MEILCGFEKWYLNTTMILLFILAMSVIVERASTEKNVQECDLWAKVEQDLKEQDHPVSCTTNDYCTGMNCSGSINGDELQVGMTVNSCSDPVSFILFINIPKLHIINWKKTFSHGDSFDVSDVLRGEFSLKRSNNIFLIGLKGKFFAPGSKYIPFASPIEIPIIKDIAVPVPPCEHQLVQHNSSNTSLSSVIIQSTNAPHVVVASSPGILNKQTEHVTNMEVERNCTISSPSCLPNEVCRQIQEFSEVGSCVCDISYIRNQDGKCIYDPTAPSTSASPQRADMLPISSADSHVHHTPLSVLLVSILVPVTIVMAIVAIGFASVKMRLCHRLRRRLHVHVYEQVLLGQDDEDTDEPLTDPVA